MNGLYRYLSALPLLSLFGVGCGKDDPGDTNTGETGTGTQSVCSGYPEGAVEPMALGEVLTPYRWPVAIHRDGRPERPNLRLATVPCADDEDIDWSPFDVLLFVSIPAW